MAEQVTHDVKYAGYVARQEADVTTERHHRPADEQARIGAVVDDAPESRGEREQGLTGSGFADEGNQLHVVIEQ